MRKGYTHKVFNQSAEQGLSDNLIGDIKVENTVKKTDIENLDVISRGKVPPNPSE